MVEPTIHVRGEVRIYSTPEVPNNFPFMGVNDSLWIWLGLI